MGRVAASGMDIRNWSWSCRVLYVSGCLFLTRRKKEALPCLLFGRSILDSVVKLKACYALLTYNEERPYGGTSKA